MIVYVFGEEKWENGKDKEQMVKWWNGTYIFMFSFLNSDNNFRLISKLEIIYTHPVCHRIWMHKKKFWGRDFMPDVVHVFFFCTWVLIWFWKNLFHIDLCMLVIEVFAWCISIHWISFFNLFSPFLFEWNFKGSLLLIYAKWFLLFWLS